MAAVESCPLEPEDICTRLAREIDELVNRDKRLEDGGGRHGLKNRFREQIEGKNGPPGSGVGDPDVWESHDRAIKEQQRGLRDRLNDFNKNNCGDMIPIPEDAWEWATKPAPVPAQWVGPAPVPAARKVVEDDSGFMKKMAQLTGLTGTALIIYVILSEGSRLFPPRNLIPAP